MSHDFARSQRLKKESARKPARKKSGGVPSWLWMLVGTLVGCLVMFLVYLSGAAPQLPKLKPVQSVAPEVAQSEQKINETAALPKRVSPVFEFYTKLPEGGQPVTDIPLDSPSLPTAGSPSADAAVPPTEAPPVLASAPATETLDPIQQLLAEKEAAKAASNPAAVKPEPIKPEAVKQAAIKPEAKSSGSGRYLQTGVFRNKAEVDKLKARLALLGMKPTVQSVNNAKGETLQKVLVGPFSSPDDMDDAKIILNGNGVSTIPVK